MEAHRLRKRLRGYYEAEGATHSVRHPFRGNMGRSSSTSTVRPSQEAAVPAILESRTIRIRRHRKKPDPNSWSTGAILHPYRRSLLRQVLALAPRVARWSLVLLFIACPRFSVGESPIPGKCARPRAGEGRAPLIVPRTFSAISNSWLAEWPTTRLLGAGGPGNPDSSANFKLHRFESAGHPIASDADQCLFRSRPEGARLSHDIPLTISVARVKCGLILGGAK